mmetsp:Transcript_12367/g.33375  ORF Transcript_12367/g.33375 Transcript_12367/m.33375 type:complete len:201 (+) Transcript_12367:185-787(+)
MRRDFARERETLPSSLAPMKTRLRIRRPIDAIRCSLIASGVARESAPQRFPQNDLGLFCCRELVLDAAALLIERFRTRTACAVLSGLPLVRRTHPGRESADLIEGLAQPRFAETHVVSQAAVSGLRQLPVATVIFAAVVKPCDCRALVSRHRDGRSGLLDRDDNAMELDSATHGVHAVGLRVRLWMWRLGGPRDRGDIQK